jgi:hypothetical protein
MGKTDGKPFIGVAELILKGNKVLLGKRRGNPRRRNMGASWRKARAQRGV